MRLVRILFICLGDWVCLLPTMFVYLCLFRRVSVSSANFECLFVLSVRESAFVANFVCLLGGWGVMYILIFV